MSDPEAGARAESGTWVDGPALTTSVGDLVAWFDAQAVDGAPRITRGPLVLRRGPAGWSTRGATIGAVAVHADDAALGVGLATRANRCAEATCALLVEGVWRGTVDGTYTFEVRAASSAPITAAELAEIGHVQVRGGP